MRGYEIAEGAMVGYLARFRIPMRGYEVNDDKLAAQSAKSSESP